MLEKKVYCEFCGKPYNPNFTFFHGEENHLILRIKRFHSTTGERLPPKSPIKPPKGDGGIYMVSQRVAKEILIELGGIATTDQIRKRAAEKDPLSCNEVKRALWGLSAWREVEFHPKTRPWD